MEKARLEALSDGIFAFAMTLLVITLTVPVVSRDQAPLIMVQMITGLSHEFLIFIIAFFVIAGFWLSHSRILGSVPCVDSSIIRINIFHLFFVVMIPFSTQLSGDYGYVTAAVLVFHLNLLAASVLLSILRLYIRMYGARLTPEGSLGPPGMTKTHSGMAEAGIIPGITLIAIVVSFYDPGGSMWCYLLIPLVLWGLRILRRHVPGSSHG